MIQIWDLANRRELLKLKGHREAVHDVAFSPDGRLLASVSADGSVKVWSALPGREIFDCTRPALGSQPHVRWPPARLRLPAGLDRHPGHPEWSPGRPPAAAPPHWS